MESTTKSSLTEHQIRDIFLDIDRVASIKELKDGCFNTSYAVTSVSNREFVIKVSPPEEASVLAYEENMMESEVLFHKKVMGLNTLPIASILKDDFTQSVVPHNYFIMEKLKGRPLDKIDDLTDEERISICSELAKYMAAMHRVGGNHFGYPFMSYEINKDYFTAFRHMVKMILQDGRKKSVELPVSEEQILSLLEKYKDSYSGIREPVFVHFDLWDGNVFAEREEGSINITGLIDFERGFYGDPAADFSQIQGYMDLEKNRWFFDKYNHHASTAFTADQHGFNRIYLFRFYLFLIMIVESYYRDVNGSYNWQLQWSSEELMKLYDQLK
jgi:aminoglycoside phosphotransferase (APT) family kinase protein